MKACPVRHDQALLIAAVPNRPTDRVDARGQRYDVSLPDGGDDLVLADDPVPVADQLVKKVDHLRRDGDCCPIASQLATVHIKREILEGVTQAGVFHGPKRWPAA